LCVTGRKVALIARLVDALLAQPTDTTTGVGIVVAPSRPSIDETAKLGEDHVTRMARLAAEASDIEQTRSDRAARRVGEGTRRRLQLDERRARLSTCLAHNHLNPPHTHPQTRDTRGHTHTQDTLTQGSSSTRTHAPTRRRTGLDVDAGNENHPPERDNATVEPPDLTKNTLTGSDTVAMIHVHGETAYNISTWGDRGGAPTRARWGECVHLCPC
jgi:hypothetical protein